jgi:hypothetical protein
MHSIFSSLEDIFMAEQEDTNPNPASTTSATASNNNSSNNQTNSNQNSQADPFYSSLKDYATNDTFLKLLDFSLVPTKDTEITASMSVTDPISSARSILKGDRSVYCTKKKHNVNLLFKFNDKEQRYFVLTHLIIKVPEQHSGYM